MSFVCLHCWGNDPQCHACRGDGFQKCDRCDRCDASEMVEGGYYCAECASIVEQDYADARDFRLADLDRCDLPKALQYDYLDADAEREDASLYGKNFRSYRDLYEAWERDEV